MTAGEARSGGDWDERWSAEEVGLLRAVLGLSKASFADRLEIHQRTARRWEKGETAAIDYRVIAALDDLLCETVCQATNWPNPLLVRHMKRREVLRRLAAGAYFPVGGAVLLSNGSPRRIGASDLAHVEAVSAGLADMYTTVPSEALIGPVGAHLEDATRLLRESVPSVHLPWLHTLIGDLGVFLGYLSFNERRLAQAKAYLGLAKGHAREAGNTELLARVSVASGCASSNIASGQRAPSQDALKLLEEADGLARRASPRLQALAIAHLSEERAVAEKPYGSDEAFARSQEAFAVSERAEPAPHHPCAVADYYSLSNGEGLAGYQGIREVLLGRGEQAAETLTAALGKTQAPRRRVVILADLGEALVQQDEPDESCDRLSQGYAMCQAHHFPFGVQRIVGVRLRFPRRFAGLDCVQGLDEQLGLG